MKQFWQFIYSNSRLKLNFFLSFILLSLIPSQNHYYNLDLTPKTPLIRALDYPLPTPDPYPVNLYNTPAPYLTARSAIVIDPVTKNQIYIKNQNQRLLPASTTKIVTALVALDHFDLDKVITIDSVHQTGQTMKLVSGEKITVKNLLYGILVQSANDAATVLAQNFPGGEDAFIQQMNQKVKSLGLSDTNFTNATGLDAYEHYTTVHDLALIAVHAMENPTFQTMVSTTGITVTDTSQEITHDLNTINKLLGQIPGLLGVKTGWTELAGECLVTYTKRDNHAIITVVLGSQDRFGESAQLINWVFNNHRWQPIPPHQLSS